MASTCDWCVRFSRGVIASSRGDRQRFIVPADEILTAFVELEAAVKLDRYRDTNWGFIDEPSPTGDEWEYQMISAMNPTELLNQANTQGAQGSELAGFAVDMGRSDKYVGLLKRKKQ